MVEVQVANSVLGRIRITTDDGHILDLHKDGDNIIINSDGGITTDKGAPIINQHLLPDVTVRQLMDWLNTNFDGS